MVGGKEVICDMRADLDIDYALIQQQLEDTPSEFAYWAALHSEVKLQVAIAERKLKTLRGKVASELINECIKGGVKPTDKSIQMAIEADPRISEQETRVALLEKHCGKLYYMVEAIRMKAENVRSLSGFAKIEFSQGH
jgi:hypothetical protein